MAAEQNSCKALQKDLNVLQTPKNHSEVSTLGYRDSIMTEGAADALHEEAKCVL